MSRGVYADVANDPGLLWRAIGGQQLRVTLTDEGQVETVGIDG